jgi:hypothetical protein
MRSGFMSILKGLDDFSVDCFEYGFLVQDTDTGSGEFNLYIPKLMPSFSRNDPTKVNWTFNNNIFLNDAKCKPRTSTRIQTQNYVSVNRHFNRNFNARANNDGIIKKGTRFIIQIMDENIRDMRISDVV